jgi:hypothetical protein
MKPTFTIASIRLLTGWIGALGMTKVPGKAFNLILKFEQLPTEFSNGKVTIETSLASLPTIEVPMTVAVP